MDEKTIYLEVADQAKQSGAVVFSRPGFLTFHVGENGKLIIMVYEGLDTSELSEPIGAFDGNILTNRTWEK